MTVASDEGLVSFTISVELCPQRERVVEPELRVVEPEENME